MKFYLSSYRLGDEVLKLKKLVEKTNKKTAYIANALDFSTDQERREKSEKENVLELENIGLEVEKVDLRDYFNRKEELEKKISDFDVIWVRGGNVFALRQAMWLSGFDTVLKKLQEKEGVVYGGYSAGICVLGPTMRGLEMADDTHTNYYGEAGVVWDGVGILDYTLIPHYKSDHPESYKVDLVVEYMKSNNIPFKTLRDGEVLIME